jgi:hypothetical protein
METSQKKNRTEICGELWKALVIETMGHSRDGSMNAWEHATVLMHENGQENCSSGRFHLTENSSRLLHPHHTCVWGMAWYSDNPLLKRDT